MYQHVNYEVRTGLVCVARTWSVYKYWRNCPIEGEWFWQSSWSDMPRSHIHGSPRRFYYGLNLMDDHGNANFCSLIRMHYIPMIKYYYLPYNTESYGPIRIATNVHPWLIRRPVRDCVTWAIDSLGNCFGHEWIKKFFRFCLCIFESDTVKSDCPVQIFRKMIKYLRFNTYRLLVYLTVCSGDIKKATK